MGRHFAPDAPPEPARGLRRLPGWLRQPGPLALLVIAALIVACGVWAVVDINRDIGLSSEIATGPTWSAAPMPPVQTPPTGELPSGAVPTGTATPVATPTAGVVASPDPARPTTPPAGPTGNRPPTSAGPVVPASSIVSGVYARTQLWPGRFEAEITLNNRSSTASTWEAVLQFPDGVTANVAFWVEGGQTPTRTVKGKRWTFTGAAPVAAGGVQVLKMQFDISDQAAASPLACTVNGKACV